MIALLVALAVVEPGEVLLGLSSARERDALPGPVKTLIVDPWDGSVRLKVDDAAQYARRLKVGALCTPQVANRTTVELRCTERRLFARTTRDKRGFWLDMYALRGLPWNGLEELQATAFALKQIAPGEGDCPGKSAGAQAECLYRAGELEKAKEALVATAKSASRTHALLRLGDVALAQGRPDVAIEWWSKSPGSGPFGRLTTARLCEITGDCFGTRLEDSAFDSLGLPEPLRTELELRRLRMLALTGRVAEAAKGLEQRQSDVTRQDACSLAPQLCRQLALAALRDPDAGAEGLALYLSLPLPTRGALAPELAQAAARMALELGAPGFGGSVLADSSGLLSGEELHDQLKQAASMFMTAGDTVRAGIVCRYASGRFGKAADRWCVPASGTEATPRAAPEVLEADVGASMDVSGSVLARSRAARARIEEGP